MWKLEFSFSVCIAFLQAVLVVYFRSELDILRGGQPQEDCKMCYC